MLLIARSARIEDMIVASLQPKENKVVAWSEKARLPLTHPNTRQPSSAWIVQKRPCNLTSQLMKTNVQQSLADFLGCQVRPAAKPWRSCVKALPIDVLPHQPPLSYG